MEHPELPLLGSVVAGFVKKLKSHDFLSSLSKVHCVGKRIFIKF